MRTLAGKTAVVTGGSSGIGLGICRACVAERMNVVVADIEKDRGDAVSRELGASTSSLEVDVTDPVSTLRLADEAYARFGRVDLLFCNAGALVIRPLLESTRDDWDAILGVNLFGVVNTLQSFVPRMVGQPGERHVVVTASMASLRAPFVQEQSMYTASKFAVFGLTEAWEHELESSGIGLTVVFPGPVRSDLGAGSERRRPGSLGHGVVPSGNAPFPAIEAMDPDVAGRMIVDGARAGRRYLATHPEMLPQVEAVHRRVAEGFSTPGK